MGKINAKILMNKDVAKSGHSRPVNIRMGVTEFRCEVLRRFTSNFKAANYGIDQKFTVNEFLILLSGQKIRDILQ